MARRNGERLAAAKQFITQHIQAGHDVTVQQVQEQFADVATCRSIYRWIAQARAAMENPGQVNLRSLARTYIGVQVESGAPCRVIDVLNRFPGVASTTTIYRWLHEAKRPDLLHGNAAAAHNNPSAFLWHILLHGGGGGDDDDSSAPAVPTQHVHLWNRIRHRHAQLCDAVQAAADGEEHGGADRSSPAMNEIHNTMIAEFPDVPIEVIDSRLGWAPRRSPAGTFALMKLEGSAEQGESANGSPIGNSKTIHLCCDCGVWMDDDEAAWIPERMRPQPWEVAERLGPVSVKYVHTRHDFLTGESFVTMCGSCLDKVEQGEDDSDSDMEMEGESTTPPPLLPLPAAKAAMSPDALVDMLIEHVKPDDGSEMASTALALLDLYTSA